MDPLELMNSDCWKEVIDLLNGHDKHSLSATCRTFEYLLQPKRSEWIFEAILRSIIDWLDVPVRQRLTFRGYERRNPTWMNLLKCRLVSKSWCSTVDNFMANWYKDEEESAFGYNDRYPKLPDFYSFFEGDGQSFVEKFPNQFRNPFFGRCVEFRSAAPLQDLIIQNENENENQEVVEAQVPAVAAAPLPYSVVNGQLLELYGKQIWKVRLTTFVYEKLRVNFYQNFQRLLSLLLNLKTLKIMLSEQIPQLTEENYRAQAELVYQFPLPELPCLERIQYYGRGHNCRLIELLLDKYCGGLKHLEWNTGGLILRHFTQMKCLRTLDLVYSGKHDRILEALRALQSPLESLSLFLFPGRLGQQDGSVIWYMDRFLKSIQHLPIRNLKLILGRHDILSCDDETYPLPESYPENTTIQTLFIKSFDNVRASFNFLQKLKSLASFTFHHLIFFVHDRTSIAIMDLPNVPKVLELEYCTSKENVHLMKIWGKVPSLKTFTYKKGGILRNLQQNGDVDLVFSRDEYNQLVLENTEPE